MKSVKLLTFNRSALRVALASALALAGTGFVGNAYAVTGDATANVVQAITVAQTRAMNFGKMVSTTGHTVILSAEATTSVSGTATRPLPSTAASGHFTVTGDGQATYTLTIPTSAITLTGPSTPTMSVGTFTSSVATTAGAGLLGGTTGSAGTQSVYIGATLTQGTSPPAGLYSGTYTVTVAYN